VSQSESSFALEQAEAVFTALSLILAEKKFAKLDERVLTHSVRVGRIPHCRLASLKEAMRGVSRTADGCGAKREAELMAGHGSLSLRSSGTF
jgi:hypothetical protein